MEQKGVTASLRTIPVSFDAYANCQTSIYSLERSGINFTLLLFTPSNYSCES